MFIPVIVPPQPPSREANELGEEIAQLVREYLADNQNAHSQDVSQAFEVARSSLRSDLGGSIRNQKILVAFALGMAMFIGLVVVFVSRQGTPSPQILPMIGVVAVIAVVGVVFALRR